MLSSTRVFGENKNEDGEDQVFYFHSDGTPPYRVDGIFEATTEVIDLETGTPVMSNQPRFGIALSKLVKLPVRGDNLAIRTKSYTVVELDFDGQGTVTLRLHVVLASQGGES
ncbi:MAG: head-tail joining protein [Steroidobacteraceae bacterium]